MAISKDIVIGPYCIEPEYRGFGYGKRPVHTLLHEAGLGLKQSRRCKS